MTQPPPHPGKLAVPTGAPERLAIEGILDGRPRDTAAMRAAVDALSRCGAGRFRVDFDGGRFSVIAEQPHRSGEAFDSGAQALFLDHLQRVVEAAEPGSVETNLRCRLTYADQIQETLFSVRDGVVVPLTRRRARTASDAPLDPPGPANGGPSRRQLLVIGPLVLLAGLLLAWQSGWIHRAFAAPAERIAIDSGPFGDLVTVGIERSWGRYRVTLRRGEGYPETPAALRARKDAAETLAQQAAIELVGTGGRLFVQLQDEAGGGLDEATTELRDLLADPAATIEVALDGHPAAQRVVLSLSRAPRAR